jgi:hypothetical protein
MEDPDNDPTIVSTLFDVSSITHIICFILT